MGFTDWLFGGGATNNVGSSPQTAGYQREQSKRLVGAQAPMMDATQSNEVRGQQGQLAGMLFNQASGATPGAGEMAVNRQVGQAQAANAAQAASSRGANAALAGRQMQRTNAEMGVAGAGQAAQAQMQDQQAAQGQLGALLGQQRSGDISVAGQNQQAQMQQQQIQLGALAQMLGVDQAQLQAQLQKAQIKSTDNGSFGHLLTGAGALLAASDIDLKTNIENGDEKAEKILEGLQAYSFRYEDTKHGEGEQFGVMAQDLEAAGLGHTVIDTPHGKMIDGAKVAAAALALVASLAKRVAELESRK